MEDHIAMIMKTIKKINICKIKYNLKSLDKLGK